MGERFFRNLFFTRRKNATFNNPEALSAYTQEKNTSVKLVSHEENSASQKNQAEADLQE